MKILHTADWHLGKYLNNFSLLDDQRYVLQKFLEIVRAHQPDVILLAGDVYDRSVPPADAIKLFDEVMSEIILHLKIPVIAIAGNHDNPQRVGYCNAILEKQGLYMFGQITSAPPLTTMPQITLHDAFGEVHFFPIPYTEPETLRYFTALADTELPIRTHQDTLAWIVQQIDKQCPTGRRVLIGHAFVAGGEASDSERDLLIGGAAYVETSLFDKFTYTALGHLHRPQTLGNNVRYAGSPLKYSFSEATHKKTVTMLTLDAQGIAEKEEIALPALRDMHRITGIIEDYSFKITSKNPEAVGEDDFLEVTLENEHSFLNPMAIVQKSFKNAMHLRRAENKRKRKTDGIDASSLKDMTELDLFTAFYQKCHTDTALTDKQIGFLRESIQSLRK